MKLTDLRPNWVSHGGEGVYMRGPNYEEVRSRNEEPSIDNGGFLPIPRRDRIGISFDCPCGKKINEDSPDAEWHSRIYIMFRNPEDGLGPVNLQQPHASWEREGTTFETLTIKPSILRKGGCGWHGWVTNGEVTSC